MTTTGHDSCAHLDLHTRRFSVPFLQVLSIPTATTLRSGSLPAAMMPAVEAPNGSVQPAAAASIGQKSPAQQAPAVQPRGAVSAGLQSQELIPDEQGAESAAPAPSALFLSLFLFIFMVARS